MLRKPPIRLASYNADNGRPPPEVLDEVLGAIDRFRLDAWTIQEGSGYVRALRRGIPGWRVQTGGIGGQPGRDSYFIVRPGLRTRGMTSIQMHGRWERRPARRDRGLHPARVLNVQRVGWIGRVAAIHFPPTPNIARLPKRNAAWEEYLRVLNRQVARWNRRRVRWVLAGDFNVRADSPQIQRFAERHGARVVGTGIDYFVVGPGIQASNYRKPRWGHGDHGHLIYVDLKRVRFRAPRPVPCTDNC